MDNLLGLLRIRVKRGINLAVRDLGSSDPYVVVTMGNQDLIVLKTLEVPNEFLDMAVARRMMETATKLKTRVVKRNCNPEWNEELTLSMTDLNVPINFTVFDKDRFTVDDKMGDAEVDIKPYIASLKMGLQNLPDGCVVSRVQPSKNNCLAGESCIVWEKGKIIQDMILRLRNVESGELVVQIEWITVPGCRGLEIEDRQKPWKWVPRSG